MLGFRQVSDIVDILTSQSELLRDGEVERARRVDGTIIVLACGEIVGTKDIIPGAALLLDHGLCTKARSSVCDVNA